MPIMSQNEVEKAMERFLDLARRREKRHRRSFKIAALLSASMVPVVVAAGGMTPGPGTVITFGLLFWASLSICRFLGRGRPKRPYVDLAEELAGQLPNGSAAHQAALACLIRAKPRKGLLDELIQRVPGAAQLDAVTAGGTVSFAPVGPAAPAPADTAKADGKSSRAEGYQELLSRLPLVSQDEMKELLEDEPDAQALMAKLTKGNGRGFHKVTVVRSSSYSPNAAPGARQESWNQGVQAVQASPPDRSSPERPAPEASSEGKEDPTLIPLDPYGSGKSH